MNTSVYPVTSSIIKTLILNFIHVIFSEKGTLNLQRTDIDVQILCTDNECQDIDNKKYINCDIYVNVSQGNEEEYIKLEEQADISLDKSEDNVCDDFNNSNDYTEVEDAENNSQDNQTEDTSKKKSKKSKKKGFEKIELSVEQQKAELEGNRREKKYLEAEFKCFNCALGFLFKDTYQAHMMRHEEVIFLHTSILML